MNTAEEEKTQEAKEAIERVTGARDKMKYRNRIITFPDGRQFITLSRKSTANPKLFIYLMRSRDEEHNSSLWNFEFEECNINMWPYDGADSDFLLLELLEDHVEHAFETD